MKHSRQFKSLCLAFIFHLTLTGCAREIPLGHVPSESAAALSSMADESKAIAGKDYELVASPEPNETYGFAWAYTGLPFDSEFAPADSESFKALTEDYGIRMSPLVVNLKTGAIVGRLTNFSYQDRLSSHVSWIPGSRLILILNNEPGPSSPIDVYRLSDEGSSLEAKITNAWWDLGDRLRECLKKDPAYDSKIERFRTYLKPDKVLGGDVYHFQFSSPARAGAQPRLTGDGEFKLIGRGVDSAFELLSCKIARFNAPN